MESSFTKDQNIDFSLHLDKENYRSGDYVNGVVLINAKSDRPYGALTIKLIGEQNVKWTVGAGKHKRTYHNKKTIYDDQFLIHNFDKNKLPKGQHSFRFLFLLPSSMSGSLSINGNCYLKYNLIAILESIDEKVDTQWIAQQLKIKEPFRGILGTVSTQKVLRPQCCFYFSLSGLVTVNLICNKNCIKPGQQVYAYAQINNIFCTYEITKIFWRTKCNQYYVSNNGLLRKLRPFFKNYFTGEKVRPGQTRNFQFQKTIFEDIKDSTVIGSAIARFFTLELCFSVGPCNFQQSNVQVHIFIEPQQAQNLVSKQFSNIKPQNCKNWQPLQHQLTENFTLKPFKFNKNDKISYQNQGYEINYKSPLSQMEKKISIKQESRFNQSEQVQQKEEEQATKSLLKNKIK